jgi:hypothetical protein
MRKAVIIISIIVLSITLLGGGIVYFVMSLMKSSDAYQMAVKQAKADVRVNSILGTPIDESFFVTGNIQLVNDNGNANLFITLSGPKDKATVNAIASKAGGVWTMHKLDVLFASGAPRLDLLATPAITESAEAPEEPEPSLDKKE